MPRTSNVKGFSGIAQTFEQWSRGDPLFPDVFLAYNQSAEECRNIGTCRDQARLEIMTILFFVIVVTVVSGVFERVKVYRKMDTDKRLYWLNCCLRTIYACAIATSGLWYILQHKDAGVLAGRDPESEQLLCFAQGFYLFQSVFMLLELPFSKLVRSDYRQVLQTVILAVTCGTPLMNGHGSWGWLLVLTWELTTPFPCVTWLLNESGYGNSVAAGVARLLSVVAFAIRNCVAALFWQTVIKEWDEIRAVLDDAEGAKSMVPLLVVASMLSVEGLAGLRPTHELAPSPAPTPISKKGQ